MPIHPEHETERYGDDPYRSVELITPEELREFALAFRSFFGKILPDLGAEEKEIDKLTQHCLRQQKDANIITRFYGLRDGQTLIATGRLQVRQDQDSKEKVALLSHLSVDPRYRGKKLSTRLSQERIAEARSLGATRILAHVAQANPASLSLKLREGFQVTGFMYYDNAKRFGRFEVSQSLTETQPGNASEQASHQEVLLSDTKTLDELLHSGWVGIKLGGTRDDPQITMVR